MSKQHHFVVMYDTEMKRFYLDDDTQFFDGTIWDTETNQWSCRVEDDTDEALDETLYNTLSVVLTQFNEHGSLQEVEEN